MRANLENSRGVSYYIIYSFRSAQGSREGLNNLVDTGMSSPRPLPEREEALVNTLLCKSERRSPKRTAVPVVLLFNGNSG